MRYLAVIPLALLSMGAAPPAYPGAPAPQAGRAPPSLEGRSSGILPTTPAHCPDAEPRRTDGQPLRARRLDRLPQGNLSLAVMREVDGCPQATTVRQGYGAPVFRR
jgi:hypothetical protein